MRFGIAVKGLYPNGGEGEVFAEIEQDGLCEALDDLAYCLRYHLGSEWQLGDGKDSDETFALDVTITWKEATE